MYKTQKLFHFIGQKSKIKKYIGLSINLVWVFFSKTTSSKRALSTRTLHTRDTLYFLTISPYVRVPLSLDLHPFYSN